MPLGLPPHLATSTASLAVVRGGHAAAAACLVAAAAVVVTLQYTIPDIAVWPALIVLAPMIGDGTDSAKCQSVIKLLKDSIPEFDPACSGRNV
mgnify:CR=1 FL=1